MAGRHPSFHALFGVLALGVVCLGASKAPPKKSAPAPTAKTGKGVKTLKTAKVQKAPPANARRTRSAHAHDEKLRPDVNRFLELPPEAELVQSPAYRYANYANEQAYAALDQRGIAYERVVSGPETVRAPIRLRGPLHGVNVHSTVQPGERATTPYEVLDARLALALDEFCAVLERHDIVEVVHYSIYRPGGSPAATTDGGATRHPAGLAIDAAWFKKRDGHWLDVKKLWPGDVGAKTCGPGAKAYDEPNTSELVGIVCEAAETRLFQYLLTPHYNAAHKDHFHLEVKPGVRWFLVN